MLWVYLSLLLRRPLRTLQPYCGRWVLWWVFRLYVSKITLLSVFACLFSFWMFSDHRCPVTESYFEGWSVFVGANLGLGSEGSGNSISCTEWNQRCSGTLVAAHFIKPPEVCLFISHAMVYIHVKAEIKFMPLNDMFFQCVCKQKVTSSIL